MTTSDDLLKFNGQHPAPSTLAALPTEDAGHTAERTPPKDHDMHLTNLDDVSVSLEDDLLSLGDDLLDLESIDLDNLDFTSARLDLEDNAQGPSEVAGAHLGNDTNEDENTWIEQEVLRGIEDNFEPIFEDPERFAGEQAGGG